MLQKRGLEPRKAFGRLVHARFGPAQRHLRVMPPLHVPADQTDHRVHRLDDVGAGERVAQFEWLPETDQGENFIHLLEDGLLHTDAEPFEELMTRCTAIANDANRGIV